MVNFKVIFMICGILALVGCHYAESSTPSRLIFDFYQNNNTYSWENSLNKDFDFGRLNCNLDINTSSTLLKKPYNHWQEHLRANFNADYKIANGFSIAPFISHSRNALQNRVVYTSELKISTPYKRFRFFDLNPFVANKAIKRVGEEPTGVDKGLGYGLSANSKPLRIIGNNLESSISYEYYDLNRIPFSRFNARLGGLMTWSKSDSLHWVIKNAEGTTRYYSSSGQSSDNGDVDNIVRQVKVDRSAQYLTKVELLQGLSARINGDMDFISYYYTPGKDVQSISQLNNYTEGRDNFFGIEWDVLENLRLSTGYRYSWGKEDYGGKQLDQWHEMGELSFNASAEISSNDSTVFNSIVGVNSYYGLHKRSAYDRDLKTRIHNIRHKHLFSRYFNGEVRFGYSNFNQIYISELNSANNNQNETYFLRSTFNWMLTSGISLSQSFEIRANYIIHEYIPSQIDTPDRIFRRGSSELELKVKLSDRFTVMPGYIYRYEDYGKLIWEENNWQQATGWDRRYHNLNMKVSYYPWRNVSIEPEYSWESKKEYNHELGDIDNIFEDVQIIRELRLDDLKQIAACSINWNFSAAEYLSVSYSRRKWETVGRETDITEFVNVSVRYLF